MEAVPTKFRCCGIEIEGVRFRDNGEWINPYDFEKVGDSISEITSNEFEVAEKHCKDIAELLIKGDVETAGMRLKNIYRAFKHFFDEKITIISPVNIVEGLLPREVEKRLLAEGTVQGSGKVSDMLRDALELLKLKDKMVSEKGRDVCHYAVYSLLRSAMWELLGGRP